MQERHPQGLARYWPILAALLLGLIHPLLASAFALVMAVVRRNDTRMNVALLVIGMLWTVFLSLFAGVSGGGVTTGS